MKLTPPGLELVSSFKDRYLDEYMYIIKNEAVHGKRLSIFAPQVVKEVSVFRNTSVINTGNHPYIYGGKGCIPSTPTDFFSIHPQEVTSINRYLESGALILKSLNNYGHALWDTIGLLLLIKDHSIRELSSDSLRICVPVPNAYFSMWLSAFEIDLSSRIHFFNNAEQGSRLLVEPGNYFVACPPYISIILFLVDWFRKYRRSLFAPKPELKVFLTRGPERTRVANYASILDSLVSAGYKVVNDLSLSTTQIRDLLCRCSKVAVEPGAGSANLVFCHPEAEIISLVPSLIIDDYSESPYRTAYSTFYAYSFRNKWQSIRGHLDLQAEPRQTTDAMATKESYCISGFI
jgi:hypothetical protein